MSSLNIFLHIIFEIDHQPKIIVNEEMRLGGRSDMVSKDANVINLQSTLAKMKLRYEDDEDGRHLRYEANIKSEAIITEDWSDDLASDIDELTFGTPSKVTRVKETRDIILSRPSTKKTNPKKALACPFLKHNPERYQEDKPCSCTSWETASRVKYAAKCPYNWVL